MNMKAGSEGINDLAETTKDLRASSKAHCFAGYLFLLPSLSIDASHYHWAVIALPTCEATQDSLPKIRGLNRKTLRRAFFAAVAASPPTPAKEVLTMDKKKPSNQLTIDVKIHYQRSVYDLSLRRLLQWLFPLAFIGIRLMAYLRDSSK